MVALIGLLFAGGTAALFRDPSPQSLLADEFLTLSVRLGLSDEIEARLLEVLNRLGTPVQPLSVSTTRHGAALALVYRIRLRPGVTPRQLVTELNRTEGVQELELQREHE